jgi:hypothetical protein
MTTTPSEERGKTMDTFSDLIYDTAPLPLIRAAFPHVVVKDASDYIHEDRVEIVLPVADRRAFFRHAILNGYTDLSLSIQLLIRMPGCDGAEDLDEVVARLRTERANKESPNA